MWPLQNNNPEGRDMKIFLPSSLVLARSTTMHNESFREKSVRKMEQKYFLKWCRYASRSITLGRGVQTSSTRDGIPQYPFLFECKEYCSPHPFLPLLELGEVNWTFWGSPEHNRCQGPYLGVSCLSKRVCYCRNTVLERWVQKWLQI